jgi:hypothetical protein
MEQATHISNSDDTPSYWQLIAYDETGRVVARTDFRSKERTFAEMSLEADNLAKLHNWDSHVIQRRP